MRDDSFEHAKACGGVGHRDVDVKPAHVLPEEARAELRLHPQIPLGTDDGRPHSRSRMRADGDDRKAMLRRALGHLVPERPELCLDLLRRLQHGRRDLDERLEELLLDPVGRLAEDARPAVAGGQKRLRIDEHQLLLDAERPRRRRAEAHYLPRTPCTGRPAASHA